MNLTDYLDTGLFLDSRFTRAKVRSEAADTRFLNLFGYTGSFSVYAADGGAQSTTTVDISNTYLDWAERNFRLNELPRGPHRLERADVLQWLPAAIADHREFDLIVCDPPTFSNSKKMRETFDVDSRHPDLINGCLRILSPGGALYFSTNSRSFSLRQEALAPCELEELTPESIPPDFRNRKIHRCWRITQ